MGLLGPLPGLLPMSGENQGAGPGQEKNTGCLLPLLLRSSLSHPLTSPIPTPILPTACSPTLPPYLFQHSLGGLLALMRGLQLLAPAVPQSAFCEAIHAPTVEDGKIPCQKHPVGVSCMLNLQSCHCKFGMVQAFLVSFFSLLCAMLLTALHQPSLTVTCSSFSIDPFLFPATCSCSALKTFNLKFLMQPVSSLCQRYHSFPHIEAIQQLPDLQSSSQLAFFLQMTMSCAKFIPNFMGFRVTSCTISSGCCFLEIVPEVKQPESQCFEECFSSLVFLFLLFPTFLPYYNHFLCRQWKTSLNRSCRWRMKSAPLSVVDTRCECGDM